MVRAPPYTLGLTDRIVDPLFCDVEARDFHVLSTSRNSGGTDCADPIPQIVDGLMAHPELIPHEGVLGGTMGFYAAREIHILDGSCMYAEFNDGHIQGRGDPRVRAAVRQFIGVRCGLLGRH